VSDQRLSCFDRRAPWVWRRRFALRISWRAPRALLVQPGADPARFVPDVAYAHLCAAAGVPVQQYLCCGRVCLCCHVSQKGFLCARPGLCRLPMCVCGLQAAQCNACITLYMQTYACTDTHAAFAHNVHTHMQHSHAMYHTICGKGSKRQMQSKRGVDAQYQPWLARPQLAAPAPTPISCRAKGVRALMCVCGRKLGVYCVCNAAHKY